MVIAASAVSVDLGNSIARYVSRCNAVFPIASLSVSGSLSLWKRCEIRLRLFVPAQRCPRASGMPYPLAVMGLGSLVLRACAG